MIEALSSCRSSQINHFLMQFIFKIIFLKLSSKNTCLKTHWKEPLHFTLVDYTHSANNFVRNSMDKTAEKDMSLSDLVHWLKLVSAVMFETLVELRSGRWQLYRDFE